MTCSTEAGWQVTIEELPKPNLYRLTNRHPTPRHAPRLIMCPVHREQAWPGADPAPRDALLRAARRDWAAQPGLREDYRKYRPNIERVISQVASRSGRRLRLRYPGTARNNAWLKNRTAALNLPPSSPAAWTTRTEHGHSPDPPGRADGDGPQLAARPHRPAGAGPGGHVIGLQRPGLLPHRRPYRRSTRPDHPLFRAPLVGVDRRSLRGGHFGGQNAACGGWSGLSSASVS